MANNGLDLQKLFAMQAQNKKNLKPLKDIEKKKIDVKYMKKDGNIDIRPIMLYMPKNSGTPIPLVYVPHYEMKEDSLEIREYLLKGWAVASCADFKDEYNTTLTYDDLVFNNAALNLLRNRTDIDKNRIAVVGGSAGGYMAMMLSAMQLGICVTVANGPICNVYFNFHVYFNEAVKYNLAAILALPEKDKKNPLKLLSCLPLPFLAVSGGFTAKLSNAVADFSDMQAWEAISPTAFADCYCNPIYINQATSDLLVPIDQLTKKYTYEIPGATLPEGYNYKMRKVDGKLNFALCDLLDAKQLNLFSIEPIDGDMVIPFAFDETKRFNVCICDEGAPEAYASHNLGKHTGRASDIDYIEYMFNKTAEKTNVLTKEKLILFAERYEGNARQLIAHKQAEPSVYGSLVLYRNEIIEELKKWKEDNGTDAFERILKQAVAVAPHYEKTMNEIAEKIF